MGSRKAASIRILGSKSRTQDLLSYKVDLLPRKVLGEHFQTASCMAS